MLVHYKELLANNSARRKVEGYWGWYWHRVKRPSAHRKKRVSSWITAKKPIAVC